MTALPVTTGAVRRLHDAVTVLSTDLAPVPLVGTAVDVPGWTDPQTCQACFHAYDDAAQPGCPHTSEPLCPSCQADCRVCSALDRQEVGGL